MKKLILLTLLLLTGFMAPLFSYADLLDQLTLEQTLQERLQNTFKMFDDSAKIVVKLEFDSYQGSLPGMNLSENEKISPEKIELNDIKKIHIDIYSSLEAIPEGAQDALNKAVPIENKKNVNINFNKVDQKFVKLSKAIEVKDLFEVAEKTSWAFAKVMGLLFVLGFAGTFFVSNSISKRRSQELKEQIKVLATAVSEGGGGSAPRATPAFTPSMSQDQNFAPAPSKNQNALLESLSAASLREIFADCYWCENDGYANWLWKNITNTQKKELADELPFIKEYSLSFVSVPARTASHHEHPYYMDPANLSQISQKDLTETVKKDIGLWHMISPMRKENMKMSFNEKLKATQSKPSTTGFTAKIKSPYRTLSATPTWGELTINDETAIFNNPAMVPEALRKHVKTLAWLALKSPETIKATLAQFDTRSLAEAWVGPEEVLKTLETHLPEKKLKLLLVYKDKSNPSRNSDVYQLLVDEGLKSEAA